MFSFEGTLEWLKQLVGQLVESVGARFSLRFGLALDVELGRRGSGGGGE